MLNQVVKEELELGFQPEPVGGQEAVQAQLSETLSSKEFSLAVAVLAKRFSSDDASAVVRTDGRNTNGV